ncbi:MAG: energy transducer TonB [Gammaproteobacteria bacterium]
MLRYAGSLMLGLLAVITVFVVMQSFVVGRQFQLTSGGSSDSGASVVNLDSQNSLASQIAALPEKPGTLHTPPLPEDAGLAQAAPPDISVPTMSLPGFKPPFTAVAAVSEAESNEPETTAETPASGAAQQPVLAVGDLVLVDRVEPKFPTQAVREGIDQGTVTVKFTVQTDGSVTNPVVTDAKPRRGVFDDAALRAVARWKFKPLSAPKDTVVTVDFNQGGGG